MHRDPVHCYCRVVSRRVSAACPILISRSFRARRILRTNNGLYLPSHVLEDNKLLYQLSDGKDGVLSPVGADQAKMTCITMTSCRAASEFGCRVRIQAQRHPSHTARSCRVRMEPAKDPWPSLQSLEGFRSNQGGCQANEQGRDLTVTQHLATRLSHTEQLLVLPLRCPYSSFKTHQLDQ